MNRTHPLKIALLVMVVLSLLVVSSCGASIEGEVLGDVSLQISCLNAIRHELHLEPKWQGVLPEDGMILERQVITLYEGDTVFDVLKRARDEHAFHLEYEGGGKEHLHRGY